MSIFGATALFFNAPVKCMTQTPNAPFQITTQTSDGKTIVEAHI